MPADSSTTTPPSHPQTRARWQPSATMLWKSALGISVFAVVMLFAIWPYQQWEFGHRMSVLKGWFIWVNKYKDWQFCLVVPVITGVLIWLRRAELRALPWRGSWLGLPLLIVGLFIYWMGYKADTGYPGFLAIQIVLASMVMLIAGREWMRALFFAWLFMFFTWPMQPLEDSVASPLRPKTAAVTSKVLSLLGTPTLSEGSALQSATDPVRNLERGTAFSLDVDAKCSGINSLFALMMISALLGYLALKSPRSRLILFVCAVPLAVLGNVARLMLLAYGSIWFGSDFAVGARIGDHQEMSPYHTFAGFAVFGVALAGMFGLCLLLEGREMRSNLKRHQRNASTAISGIHIPLPRRTFAQLIAIAAIILITLSICVATDIRFQVAKSGVTLAMPLEVGDFQGRQVVVSADEKEDLDEGVQLVRSQYLSTTGQQVMCSIVLSGHLKRSLHRPEVCLPGQGWTIVESAPITVPLTNGHQLDATTLRIFFDTKGEDGRRHRIRGVNLYCYIGSDETTSASHYEHILTTYTDAIFRNINHRWAMASIFVQFEDTGGPDSMFAEINAIQDVKEFAAKFLPLITESAKLAAE